MGDSTICSLNAAVVPSPIEEFVELVVRDYLKSKSLHQTYEALLQEASGNGWQEPRKETWQRISHKLTVPELLVKNAQEPSMNYSALLEILLHQMVHSKAMTAPPGYSAGKKTKKSSTKKKASAPGGASPPMMLPPTQQKDEAQLKTMERPKSEGALQSKEKPAAAAKTQTSAYERLHPTKKKTQIRDPKQSQKKKPTQYKPPQKLFRRCETTRKTHAQLSNESCIPMDVRMKMLRRGLAIADDWVKEAELRNKQASRVERSDLFLNQELEKFGVKHQRPCALCEQVYSEVNLLLGVPYKAIVDLRLHWHEQLGGDGKPPKINPTMKQPPQCYNEVRVCAFCSQFFEEPQRYRPTWEAKTAQARQVQLEKQKKRENEWWDPLVQVQRDYEASAAFPSFEEWTAELEASKEKAKERGGSSQKAGTRGEERTAVGTRVAVR
ncbi:unnamed protein product [Chrysoparadoxa australica]